MKKFISSFSLASNDAIKIPKRMKDYWKHGSADVQMKIKKESDPIKSNLTLHMSFYSF